MLPGTARKYFRFTLFKERFEHNVSITAEFFYSPLEPGGFVRKSKPDTATQNLKYSTPGELLMSAGKRSRFRRAAILVLLTIMALLIGRLTGINNPGTEINSDNRGAIQQQTGSYLSASVAFQEQLQEVMVEGSGTVVKVLPDDTKGSRHQRFIVKIADGQTLLIAHNIDIAPRIPNIARGDSISFRGSYVYNDRGGIVHWTHRDPNGTHPSGWLSHNGRKFQ